MKRNFRWARNLKIALKTQAGNKFRTATALLGIVMGVSTVIIMVAVSQGMRQQVMAQIEAMGTNLLVVNAGAVNIRAGRARTTSRVTTLTLADVRAISQGSREIARLAPAQSQRKQVKYGNLSTNTSIIGTTPDFPFIRNYNPEAGRFFSDEELSGAIRVAVLGNRVANDLFGNELPVGALIRIAGVGFRVVGVLAAKGLSRAGVDQDNQIFIPLTTALRRVFNLAYLSSIFVQVRDRDAMQAAEDEITWILRERHRIRPPKNDDFTIQIQTDLLEAEEEATRTFTWLVGGVAGISLLVGGIGILAVMLMTVRERTREIGVRRAFGARAQDILLQFLMEAATLSLVGGGLGIVLGITGAMVISLFAPWQAEISWPVIWFSFGFSAGVGLFFGLYPANKAAQLDPIEALRYE